MNTVIWVLIIQLNGAFCLAVPKIKFESEQACETARQNVIGKFSTECKPEKGDIKKLGRVKWNT